MGSSSQSLAKGLVLASASPQRRQLLERLGVPFAVAFPTVSELAQGEPADVALENARRKAAAVEAGGLVLAADTVVALDGEILDKPADRDQARRTLERLSGRTHTVYGGVVVKEGERERSQLVETEVRFRSLTAAAVRWYLERGEWQGRAGGYAIQGAGAALVEEVHGDYENVVGLSVQALLALLPDLLWRE